MPTLRLVRTIQEAIVVVLAAKITIIADDLITRNF